MPVSSTEAFVLRTYKLAENDKIAVLFTRDHGKVRFVAKGARKMKNRFGAALEVLTHLRITFFEKANRELQTLEHAEILFSPHMREGGSRTHFYLFYFAELVNEFFPDHEKNVKAFRMLMNIEKALKNRQNLDFLGRYIELHLLHSQGILSSVAFCSGCNRPFESLQERRYLGAGTEIFCKRCRTVESYVLSVPIVRSIDSFEKGSMDWVNTLPVPIMQELASLNQMLIQRFLGKDLQSYRLRKDLAE
ncbi:MAG TPA: DNA repair protein RecO [Acidobacteriota bacterium]|nr:DNA repair protein RecO [Acidobacteriota bacterium]